MYPLKKGKFASPGPRRPPRGHLRRGAWPQRILRKIRASLSHPSAHRLDSLRRQAAPALPGSEQARSPPTCTIPTARPSRFSAITTCAVRLPPVEARCRSTTAMPMATSCCSCIAAKASIETDFGPMPFEPGDYIVIPRAVTYRAGPVDTRQFLPHHSIEGRIRAARKRPDRPDVAVRSRRSSSRPSPSPQPALRRPRGNGEWEVRIKCEDEYSKVFYPFNPHGCGRLEGRSDGVEDQPARHPPGDEPSRASSAQRAFDFRHRRRGGVQLRAASARTGPRRAARAVLPSQHRLRRVHFLPRRRFFQPRQHQSRHVHAASARNPSRPASQGAGQSAQENADGRVRGDARRFESDARAARAAKRWSGRNIGRPGVRLQRPSETK